MQMKTLDYMLKANTKLALALTKILSLDPKRINLMETIKM